MIINSDCLEAMKNMENESIDSIVTDPPYGIHFMGKTWDKYAKGSILCGRKVKGSCSNSEAHEAGRYDDRRNDEFQEFIYEFGKEALRIAKPGAHLLMFGSPRRYHRQVCGLEDADWEIHDCLMWLYASGFPKGKSCLKPAYEPIILARKPAKKVAHLNIDDCRVETHGEIPKGSGSCTGNVNFKQGSKGNNGNITTNGRWPANVILDEEAGAMLDEKSGITASRFFKSIDHNDSFTFNNSKKSELCGLENIVEEDMFVGKKTENNEENLSIDGFGNNITGVFLKDTISIIKTETHSIMKLTILNVSTKTPIGIYIIESEKDISWLTALNVESVNDANNGYLLITFNQGQQVHIKAIAKFVPHESCKNGEIQIEKNTTPIIENIGKGTLRVFYCTKASPSERNEGLEGMPKKDSNKIGHFNEPGNNGSLKNSKPMTNFHPTVKPLKLMEYLLKLVVPKGGVVLDPFCGSGTTLVAAKKLGIKAIGIEREAEYCKIAEARAANTKFEPEQMEMNLENNQENYQSVCF